MKKFANWLYRKTHNVELCEVARRIRKNTDMLMLADQLAEVSAKRGMIDTLEILRLL